MSAVVAALIGASAQGQVLEIGSGGGMIVHDRPEVTLPDGATAIARPASRGKGHISRRQTADGVGIAPEALAAAAGGAELSPDLVEAVAWRESRLHQGVVSPNGAVGAMQLMPGTAQSLGVDPFDGAQNLRGGAAYLRGLLRRYDGDVVKALAAYNAGPGAVDRYKGVPPFKETRGYVADILDHMSERAGSGGAVAAKR